jgi:hypothetical protein
MKDQWNVNELYSLLQTEFYGYMQSKLEILFTGCYKKFSFILYSDKQRPDDQMHKTQNTKLDKYKQQTISLSVI